MNQPIIELKAVYKKYAEKGVDVQALRGVDLTVYSGEFVAIMGPSGSGKSTLMNVMGCLDLPDAGSFHFAGDDVTDLDLDALARLRNRSLGFVFQNFNLLPRTSALENVETPLIYAGVEKKHRRRLATSVLEKLGLGQRLNHLPNQLSGGQQQRVAIARALVNRPSVVLADEPTGNLDSGTSEEIMSLFQELNENEGVTIVLITHELPIAQRARRRLTLRDGLLEGN